MSTSESKSVTNDDNTALSEMLNIIDRIQTLTAGKIAEDVCPFLRKLVAFKLQDSPLERRTGHAREMLYMFDLIAMIATYHATGDNSEEIQEYHSTIALAIQNGFGINKRV